MEDLDNKKMDCSPFLVKISILSNEEGFLSKDHKAHRLSKGEKSELREKASVLFEKKLGKITFGLV